MLCTSVRLATFQAIKRTWLYTPQYHRVCALARNSCLNIPHHISFPGSPSVTHCPFIKNFCSATTSISKESERIVNKLKHQLSNLHSQSKIASLCEFLLQQDLQEDRIEYLLSNLNDVEHFSVSHLNTLADVFHEHNIDASKVFSDIKSFPAIASINAEDLIEKIVQFDLITVGSVPFSSFIEKNPYLLFVDTKHLKKRLSLIIKIFPPKEMKHVISNSPNILTDPWESVMEKIKYIDEEMGLDQPHMSYNHVLSHSMQHIRNRHEVLKRLNRYQKPKLSKNRLSYLSNRSLEDIMDCSDSYFCSSIAKITSEEWDIFQDLMQEEYQEDDDGFLVNLDEEEEEISKDLELKMRQGKKHFHDS